MRILVTCLLFFSLALCVKSQRANHWFFGNTAGLNFNTTPPTALSNGLTNLPDNSSTISDRSGNLLFYTDGRTVWNKNHAVMPNGSNLTGHATAGQCALIVPVPCDTARYVIFQTTEFASPGQLHYSVINVNLAGGMGDVETSKKNVSLGTGWTEKLCAIFEPQQNFYWLLTHKWNSADFVAFKITSTGIATQSVVSTIGSVHSCGIYSGAHDAMGQLTISQDGSKVINALTCQDQFEIFDFNITTGVLSNSIVITGSGNAWGTAFSPDNSKIFVNSIFGDKILQYDISNYNPASILLSVEQLVATGTAGYNFGYMELGPDGKLYIARPGHNVLSVVNNPNNSGSSSGFVLNGISLGNKFSTHGISRIAYNIPSAVPSLTVSLSASVICSGQTITLTANGAASYSWNTGSNSATVITAPASTSVYYVSGEDQCGVTSTKTINVLVTECLQIAAEAENGMAMVSPNPSTGKLRLNPFFSRSNSVIRILQADGKLLRTFDAGEEANPPEIDISEFSPGLYYISIYHGDHHYFNKIVKTGPSQ